MNEGDGTRRAVRNREMEYIEGVKGVIEQRNNVS